VKSLEIPKVALDALCHLNSERYPFLLESVNHNQNNRYSILFAYPSEQIILNSLDDFDFLSELESKTNMPTVNSDLPFTGGWFVYLSYELIGQIEPILRNDLLPSSQAVAIAVKIPKYALSFDCICSITVQSIFSFSTNKRFTII
jgi:anthranilate synthase component 1